MAKKSTLNDIEKAIDDLAALTAKGFEDVGQRFEQNDAAHRRFEAVLDSIQTDVSFLRQGHQELYKQVQEIDDRTIE